jgi:acetyl esterase/lipase
MTRLDVYPPEEPGCDRPVVVWVHGGAWSRGDERNRIDDKITFFNDSGFLFISINYRSTTETSGVEHPDHVTDVAAGLAWVIENAPVYGGSPERVAVLGHSAGGHLIALATTDARHLAVHDLTPAAIRCVGSYDSDYDIAQLVMRDARFEAVFTSDPEVWTDDSPGTHVAPGLGIPPFQLACRGSSRRRAMCRDFRSALTAAGVRVDEIDASSLSHEEVNTRIGMPGDAVMTPHVRDFLESCGL